MKMPNTVSDERSGCIHRLLTLNCNVRSQTLNIGVNVNDECQMPNDESKTSSHSSHSKFAIRLYTSL